MNKTVSSQNLLTRLILIFTLVFSLLSIVFSLRLISHHIENDSTQRRTMVKTSIAAFRNDLLRNYVQEATRTLQDIAPLVPTRSFSLEIRNGTPIVVRPSLSGRVYSEKNDGKCLPVKAEYTFYALFYPCLNEQVTLYFDDERRVPLAKIEWQVHHNYRLYAMTTVGQSLVLFALLGAAFGLLSTEVLKRRIVSPLNRLATQLGSASKDLQLHKKPRIEPVAESAVEEVRNIALTSKNQLEEISSLQNSLAEARAFEAIARTMQAVAHDLRKPFSMVQVILDYVTAPDSSVDREYVQQAKADVERSVKYINGLLRDVLEFGVTKSPQKSVFPYAPFLQSVTNSHAQTCRFPIDRVRVDCGEDVHMNADMHKLERVLVNLLQNAFEACMYTNGIVTVRAENKIVDNQGFVETVVLNTCSYIPEDRRASVFDAFFTSGKPNGTGLGLAICRKIILDHEGSIYCDSAKDGESFVAIHFSIPV